MQLSRNFFSGKVDKMAPDSSMTLSADIFWFFLYVLHNADTYRTAGAFIHVGSLLSLGAGAFIHVGSLLSLEILTDCSVKFTVLFLVEEKTLLITYWIGRKEVISVV